MTHELVDQYGRKISHLRLSVTDRCNFKCSYCLPDGVICPIPKASQLTISEISKLCSVLTKMGITQIRLTGGEPLVRHDLIEIVSSIKKITSIPDLSLTTNGSLLAPVAKHLKKSGLNRLNISLDSLTSAGFRNMAKQDAFTDVMDGILTALSVGFPVKLNTVIMKHINDHEIEDFIGFGLENGLDEVRFIEFMPLCGSKWQPESVYPFTQTIEHIRDKYQAIPIKNNNGSVSESYLIHNKNKSVKVGFIRTLSKPFCGECSRIRISSDGVLRPCLFSHTGTELRPFLQSEGLDDLKNAICQTIWKKEKGNEFATAYNRGISIEKQLQTKNENRSHYPSIRSIGG